MRTGPGIWVLGLGASILVNLGATVGLLAALNPQEVPDQPIKESRLNVTAQQVTRSEALAKTPSSEAAQEQGETATLLGSGVIAQSTARPMAPTAEPVAKAPIQSAPAQSIPTAGAKPSAIEPQSNPAATVAPVVTTAAPQPSLGTKTDAAPIQLAALPSSKAQTTDTPAEQPPARQARSQETSGSNAPAKAPPQSTSAAKTPDATQAPQQEPQVLAGKAVLAFPSSGRVDPVSLAAFQSFTQPETAQSADLRDDLSTALAQPCARMQVLFDPETTTLRLTGHVPDAAQRGPVLDALRAKVGADIAVADNLLVLPAPQCSALSGIAGTGLPQSTDQITNPLIVGADTHARSFRYVKGDPLVLDLTGPDYPAFVYVDYFDADGNVIHLAPNDLTPLRKVAAKSALSVGATKPDDDGLFVTIGPPYGQEIAAAFASSVPLYTEARPLVEPAGPYLEWLKSQISKARAADPTFKGEWVYFFVTTAEK